MESSPAVGLLAAVPFLALLYFAAGVAALRFETVEGHVGAIWPASGIALAALLLAGRWLWPGVFLGTLGVTLWAGDSLQMALFLSAGNTLEALLGATLLKAAGNFDGSLRRVRDIIKFMLLGGIVACAVGATIGVLTECAYHQLPWNDYGETWLIWFVANALGTCIAGPLLLVLASSPKFEIFRRSPRDLIGITLLMATATALAYSSAGTALRPVSYIVFACVIWAAFRFEQLGAVLSVTTAALITVAATMHHMAAFPIEDRNQHIALLQASLGVMAFTALVLASVSAERDAAAEELRKSESRLRAMNRAANLGAWDWELGSDRLMWLEEVPSLRGFSRLTAREWHKRIHAEDRQRVLDAIESARARCSDYYCEYRMSNEEGETVWIMSRAMFLRGSGGVAARAVGVSLDITERKRTEHELQEREAELRTMAEAIPHLLWTARADGAIDYVNHRWHEYTGLHTEDSMGAHWLAALHPDDAEPCRQRWMQSLQTGELYEFEFRLRGADGQYRWHLSRGVPLRDEEGRVTKWFGTCTDVNDRKQNEELLRRTEKLAATGKLAASIAHEINNPLAAVSNLLYLLSCEKELPMRAREYVAMADSELARVAHITRQTLMFYRESSLPLVLKTTEVLEGVLDLYSRKLEEARINVERRYDSEGLVRTMPGELRQIISNLLVNAVEASPIGGTITIHVSERTEWKHGGRHGVQVTIADEGPGIARQHLNDIFEPFFTTKGDKGTGLGLWVTHGLVEKNGGYTRVRSSTQPGHTGSVFTFFVPSNLAAEPGSGSAKSAVA